MVIHIRANTGYIEIDFGLHQMKYAVQNPVRRLAADDAHTTGRAIRSGGSVSAVFSLSYGFGPQKARRMRLRPQLQASHESQTRIPCELLYALIGSSAIDAVRFYRA